LPEHPRPDFERLAWQNLNGTWQFRFDAQNAGLKEKWMDGKGFQDKIVVPFPWGSKLSEVEDKAQIAWYSRVIRIPESWRGQRIFLVIGACDWETQAWYAF
jgi:beta-galactosidase/beta-glucuronidase